MPIDDLQTFVDDLAAQLHRSVAIDDPSIRLLAASRHFGDEDSLRITSILNRAVPEEVSRPLLASGIGTWIEPGLAQPDVPGSQKRLCVPVRCKSLLLGFLWLIDTAENPLTASDIEKAENTAMRAGIVLYERLLVRERSNERRAAILRDLVDSADDVRKQAVEDALAEQVIAEHTGHYQVVSAQRESANPAETSDDVAMEVAIQEGLQALPSGTGSIAVEKSRVWVLLATTEPLTPHQLESVTTRATSRFRQLSGNNTRFVLGTSDVVEEPGLIFRAYRHALTAVRAALLVPSLGDVARWGNLGPYDTLLRMSNDDIASAARNSPVSVLEAADRQHVFVSTLNTFFDNACDIRRTADQLCIHRATLYQRLKRIEQITECSLDNGDDRLTLHLGLKLTSLTAAREASSGRAVP